MKWLSVLLTTVLFCSCSSDRLISSESRKYKRVYPEMDYEKYSRTLSIGTGTPFNKNDNCKFSVLQHGFNNDSSFTINSRLYSFEPPFQNGSFLDSTFNLSGEKVIYKSGEIKTDSFSLPQLLSVRKSSSSFSISEGDTFRWVPQENNKYLELIVDYHIGDKLHSKLYLIADDGEWIMQDHFLTSLNTEKFVNITLLRVFEKQVICSDSQKAIVNCATGSGAYLEVIPKKSHP
jgi:hypothetical protein